MANSTPVYIWISSLDVTRDGENDRTDVTISWKIRPQSYYSTTDRDKPNPPEPQYGQRWSTNIDQPVYVGAGLLKTPDIACRFIESELYRIESNEDSFVQQLRFPSDEGTVRFMLEPTTDGIKWQQAFLNEFYGVDNCNFSADPNITGIKMDNIRAGTTGVYEVDVRNESTDGQVTVLTSGQNVQEISTTEGIPEGDVRTFYGEYKVPDSETEAKLDVEVRGADNSDFATARARALEFGLEVSDISQPNILCPNQKGSMSFAVTNTATEDNIDVTVTGNGVQPINETVSLRQGEQIEFSTDITMVNQGDVVGEIAVEGFDETVTEGFAVERQTSSPTISPFDFANRAMPGDTVGVSVEGRVSSCEVPGELVLRGEVEETESGITKPGQPLKIDTEFRMPPRKANLSAQFTANGFTERDPPHVEPAQCVLIDSTHGFTVYSPQEEIDYKAVVVSRESFGVGEQTDKSALDDFDIPFRLRVLANSPLLTSVRRVDESLRNFDTDTVQTDGMRIISFETQGTPLAVAVDGEVQDVTTSFTYAIFPRFGKKFIDREDSYMS